MSEQLLPFADAFNHSHLEGAASQADVLKQLKAVEKKSTNSSYFYG